jgi:hypothetical protein
MAAVTLTWTVILAMGSFAMGFVPCFVRPDTFDAEAWRATDLDAMCDARALMVEDLMASDELAVGRARAEVEALLGPTEDTEYWASADEGLVYVTGCWIDCDWLVVLFDHQQRLTEAYTAQD